MKKNVNKTANKITKKAQKISDLVTKFIDNGKKYVKLDAKRQKLEDIANHKLEKMQKELDELDHLIISIQDKLEKLGIDEDLMFNAALGLSGAKSRLTAIKKMKKLILK